jgi:separase
MESPISYLKDLSVILSLGYIMASIDLAHEYVKLGKSRRGAVIFNQALTAVRNGKASDEACISFFLRFAESLACAEDMDRR